MLNAHTCDKSFSKTRLAVQIEIQKRTGKENSFINSQPDCPSAFLYIWNMYNKIIKGCDKIGYTELSAYSQVYRIDLTSQEADLLIEIELLRRTNASKNR